MDIKQYAKDVCNYFDNLSDEEFDALLIRAGIEKCPYDDELILEVWKAKEEIIFYPSNMYNNLLLNGAICKFKVVA